MLVDRYFFLPVNSWLSRNYKLKIYTERKQETCELFYYLLIHLFHHSAKYVFDPFPLYIPSEIFLLHFILIHVFSILEPWTIYLLSEPKGYTMYSFWIRSTRQYGIHLCIMCHFNEVLSVIAHSRRLYLSLVCDLHPICKWIPIHVSPQAISHTYNEVLLNTLPQS